MIAQNLEWIKQGLYVDAKDKHQDWQVGLVMAITKTHIKIRFDGWSSKIDQVYPLASQRIKPFRSITKGYTGQKKCPAIRQHWIFTLDNHETRLAQFQQFVSNISQKSGFEMTQYLRGENYFYIDFLLSQTFDNVQTIKRVYDYFKGNFEFVKTYFQQFIQRDTNVWFQAGEKQQLTPKKVYAELHYEIFQSITSIIGSIPRCALFIKNNERLLREIHGNQISYETFMAKELNHVQFLTFFDNVVTKIFNETRNGVRSTPLSFINSLYSLFNGLQKLPLNAQFKKKVNNNMVAVVQEYINLMTVQDAKSIERTIEEILSLTRMMCNKLHHEKEEMCRWAEKARLKLWLNMIQCDILQKKLRGIGKVKQFYELINRKIMTPYQNSAILCTKIQFREWIDNQHLMKTIFQTNEHPQVIKKGCEMVHHLYVCRNRVCSIEDVVYVWETCFNKHEAIRRIVFEFWRDFAKHVTGDGDWRIFIGVVIRNEEKINEDWEIEALFGLLWQIKSENESMRELIKMAYRKTLKEQKYIPELAKELSFLGSNSKVLQSTINYCSQQISKKKESIFHLKLLSKVYNEMHSQKTYIPENIIGVLIEQLREFVSREQNDKLVHTIFQLLNQIMMAKDGSLGIVARVTFDNFQTLWQIFSHCPIIQFRRLLFGWMAWRSFNSLYNYSTYSINHRFTHQFRLQIFSNIFCDEARFNYRKLDYYEFAVFKEFFIYANIKAGNLEFKNQSLGNQSFTRRILKTRSKDIQGLKQLWEIFKNCQNDQVVVSCSTFLKDLYLRVSSMMPVEQKTQRTKSLMNIIQTSIVQGQRTKNYSLIKRTLILISKLLMDIKQKIQIPKQFDKPNKTQKQIITVCYTSASDAQRLQIYVQDPIVIIKSQIAKKFHLAKDQFTLFAGKFEIFKQLYELPYHLLDLDQHILRIVKISNETGKYVINNICQHLYYRIIGFLRSQQVCMEAYHLLDYLDVYQPVRLFETLEKDIQDKDEILKNKKKLYLHIFFTRVFLHVFEKQITHLDANVLLKLISHLQIPIQTSLIVHYLQKIIQILSDLHNKNSSLHKKNSDLHIKNSDLYNKNPEINNKNTVSNYDESPVALQTYRPKLYTLMLNLVKYMNNNTHTVNTYEVRLFNATLILYISGFQSQKVLFDVFIKDENFREFMFEVFVMCDVLHVRKILQKKVSAWLKEGFCSVNQQKKVAHFFFTELYYAIYQKHAKKQISGAQFTGIFKLFRTIIQSISEETLKQIIHDTPCPIDTQIDDRPISFSNHLFNSILREADSQTSPNFILNGQLQILVGMIRRDRVLMNHVLVDYLFYQCLIYVHGKTEGIEVKCLFRENITLVLEILWYAMVNVQSQQQSIRNVQAEQQYIGNIQVKQQFSNQNNQVLTLCLDKYTDTILNRFRQFHYNDEWRSSRDWGSEFLQLSKAKNDFVGLENPGCICYLNSLLQQLFMIEEFRSAILAMNTLRPATEQTQFDFPEDDSPQLIPKLKLLFLNLIYSQRPAIDPQFFTSSIRTAANRPMVKIFQQMDIDEFSMILFDKIQSKIHWYKTPNFIRDLFGGAYSNEIISQECNHSSEREEQFLSISLDVKKHITESFQSLVKGEMLEGENAYFCDGCDKKVKAQKRLSIKRLPPQLIISLRRFEFDYEADQKIKINKYCEFPFELNLQNFSQDKLNQNSISNKKPQNQPSSVSMNDQQPAQSLNKPKNNFPSEYFLYKLKGVVVHTGSADSGHYYSFIESKNGEWWQFNDERVSEFDAKNLGEEAFGGKDGEYVRIRNAYLLFYERKDKGNFGIKQTKVKGNFGNNQEQGDIQSNLNGNQPQKRAQQTNYRNQNQSETKPIQQVLTPTATYNSHLQQNKQIIEQIIMQNKKIRLWNFFFSKQYMQFVMSYIKQALYPIYGLKSNENMKQMLQYQYMMPVEGTRMIARQKEINYVEKIEHQIFQFIVSYTFLIQIRHKNYTVTFQLMQAITKIFFQHPNLEKRYNFLQTFLSQICQQSFFDEFFVNCYAKEKSKMVANFIVSAIKDYIPIHSTMINDELAKNSIKECDQIPKVVKTIVKLVMRTVIKTNTNIAELLLIIRKILALRQFHPSIVSAIITFLLKKDFATVMIDNTLGVDTPKDIRAKRVQNLENDDYDPVEIQTKIQKLNNQRKNSDISAKDQQEGSPTKKKHLNEKMQIEDEERSLDNRRFSVLFGQYAQQAGVGAKSNDKEVWTIMYLIQQQMQTKKKQIDTIKQSIRFIKNLPIQQFKLPKQQFKPSPTQPQNPPQNLEPVVNLLLNQKPNPPQQLVPVLIQDTEEDESPSMQQQSQEDQSWNEQGEGSAVNDEEVREVDAVMRIIDQVYPEVQPVPKIITESVTNLVGNDQQQIHKVNLAFGENALAITAQVDVNIDSISQNKNLPNLYNSLKQKLFQIPSTQPQNQLRIPSTEPKPQIPSNQPKPQTQLSHQQQQQLSSLQTMLSELQKQLNQMDANFYAPLNKLKSQKVMRILSQQKDTKSIVALAAFISQLVFNTLTFNDTVLTALENAFKDYESSKYRPLFLVIEKLLQIQDDLAKKRRTQILNMLRQSFRHNEKYFLQCDFIQQFILKYVTKIPTFQALIRQSPSFLSEMKSWISQKKTPSIDTVKKHRLPNCQRLSYRQHGIVVSGDLKEYQNFSVYKFECFQKLKQNMFNFRAIYPDDPKVGETYNKGDTVEVYFDNRLWTAGIVEENYFGFLLVQFVVGNKVERHFIAEDDEKVKLRTNNKGDQAYEKMEIEK